jgi:C4-type Zn-finger protein
VVDYLFGFVGILPWRCESCTTRFYARLMPFRTFLYAHCGICGNLELQRISAEHMPGKTAFLGRVLRLPALRCEPCRHKFFSVRPLRQEERATARAASK